MLRQLGGNQILRRILCATLDQVSFISGLGTPTKPRQPLSEQLILPPRSFKIQTALPAMASVSPAAASGMAARLASLPAAAQLVHLMPVRPFAAAPALAEDYALPPTSLAELMEQGMEQDIEIPVYDLNRNEIGKYVLGGDIFNVPVRLDILHRVVRWQLARRQQGTHKTKTRTEVRGGGRKPWQQKGSGRARQGTIRAPQWRGGGVVHGPVPRSHEHGLQRRVRRLGLKCALSAKVWERRFTVVDSLCPADPKTKTMEGHLAALLAGAPRRSALLIDSDKEGLDGG